MKVGARKVVVQYESFQGLTNVPSEFEVEQQINSYRRIIRSIIGSANKSKICGKANDYQLLLSCHRERKNEPIAPCRRLRKNIELLGAEGNDFLLAPQKLIRNLTVNIFLQAVLGIFGRDQS